MLSSLGNLNPFRYRGYVWDEETELYYLRSRYYSAERNRFINRDSALMNIRRLFSLNTYAYCNNNVVGMYDPDGRSATTVNYERVKSVVQALINALKNSQYVQNESQRNAVKQLAVSAAKKVTSTYNWVNTQAFFSRFMLGNGEKQYYNSSSVIAATLVKNGQIRDSILSKNPKSGDSISDTVEFTEGDLYFSLQHCSYNAIISEGNDGKLIADVIIIDRYDFTDIRTGRDGVATFGTLINDAGHVAQMTGLGTPYAIEIRLTVELE